jgi:hypothetical protein
MLLEIFGETKALQKTSQRENNCELEKQVSYVVSTEIIFEESVRYELRCSFNQPH